jgi:hypothetical protein
MVWYKGSKKNYNNKKERGKLWQNLPKFPQASTKAAIGMPSCLKELE